MFMKLGVPEFGAYILEYYQCNRRCQVLVKNVRNLEPFGNIGNTGTQNSISTRKVIRFID